MKIAIEGNTTYPEDVIDEEAKQKQRGHLQAGYPDERNERHTQAHAQCCKHTHTDHTFTFRYTALYRNSETKTMVFGVYYLLLFWWVRWNWNQNSQLLSKSLYWQCTLIRAVGFRRFRGFGANRGINKVPRNARKIAEWAENERKIAELAVFSQIFNKN